MAEIPERLLSAEFFTDIFTNTYAGLECLDAEGIDSNSVKFEQTQQHEIRQLESDAHSNVLVVPAHYATPVPDPRKPRSKFELIYKTKDSERAMEIEVERLCFEHLMKVGPEGYGLTFVPPLYHFDPDSGTIIRKYVSSHTKKERFEALDVALADIQNKLGSGVTDPQIKDSLKAQEKVLIDNFYNHAYAWGIFYGGLVLALNDREKDHPASTRAIRNAVEKTYPEATGMRYARKVFVWIEALARDRGSTNGDLEAKLATIKEHFPFDDMEMISNAVGSPVVPYNSKPENFALEGNETEQKTYLANLHWQVILHKMRTLDLGHARPGVAVRDLAYFLTDKILMARLEQTPKNKVIKGFVKRISPPNIDIETENEAAYAFFEPLALLQHAAKTLETMPGEDDRRRRFGHQREYLDLMFESMRRDSRYREAFMAPLRAALKS